MTTIEDVARACAEEWYPVSDRHHADLAALIERRLTAFLRPEGSVPVRCSVVWWPQGPHIDPDEWYSIVDAEPSAFSAKQALRTDTITAYLVPPAPEPGHDAVGVSDG